MKILLTGHGRCGSTSLHYGLSDIMNHKMVLEPFNRELWKSYYKTNPPFQKGDEIDESLPLHKYSFTVPKTFENPLTNIRIKDSYILNKRDQLVPFKITIRKPLLLQYLRIKRSHLEKKV